MITHSEYFDVLGKKTRSDEQISSNNLPPKLFVVKLPQKAAKVSPLKCLAMVI